MKLSKSNLASAILILSGAMAFGSLYSALLNSPAVPITFVNVLITILTLLIIYTGYYTYTFITLNIGNKKVAIILTFIALALSGLGMSGGWSSEQKFFALHEFLNLLAPIFVIIQLYKKETINL